MGSKYRYVLSILQIVVGILAAMAFMKTKYINSHRN